MHTKLLKDFFFTQILKRQDTFLWNEYFVLVFWIIHFGRIFLRKALFSVHKRFHKTNILYV